jgi:hypothetical protein
MEKDYFDRAMSYGNLRKALKRCCRGVRWKDSVVGYELHAAQNTHKLQDEIRAGTYRISPYQRFTIYEPKVREIVATRIADRQVQMALCEGGLYRDITEHFIHDNCACQKGKGTDFALKRVKVHLQRYYRKHGKDGWVLKCDVRKFFPSTRHDVARAAIAKRVADPRARQMVFDVIDSFGGDVGIGLGSQISQLVELAVLDDLDHMIKEKLKIRYYVQYMDDFVLIHPEKEYLERCREEIAKDLQRIGLELNRKTTIYPLRQGVKFLQWRFVLTDTGKVIMRMSGKRLGRQRRRMRKIMQKELAGEVAPGTLDNSFESWKANAERGDTRKQVRAMRAYYQKLKEELENGRDLAAEAGEDGARRAAGQDEGRRRGGQRRLYRHDGRHRNSY